MPSTPIYLRSYHKIHCYHTKQLSPVTVKFKYNPTFFQVLKKAKGQPVNSNNGIYNLITGRRI